MSFIRSGQEGEYVDIPGGSNYYLYGNGDYIGGWTYEEFAALVFDALNDVQVPAEYWQDIADGIEDELGVDNMDPDYDGGIEPPEHAEIFCQFVDRRIDDVELTDRLHEAMRDYADDFEAMKECEYCGEEFRPYLYTEPYVCSKEECDRKREADLYNVDVETIIGLEEAVREGREAHKEYWDEHIKPNIETYE